jgi:hypothetical protein
MKFSCLVAILAVLVCAVSEGGTGSKSRMMARTRTVAHYGSVAPGTYEGVGMGSTRAEAISNSCYSRSGMRVVSQSVRRGADGRFYATRTYRP